VLFGDVESLLLFIQSEIGQESSQGDMEVTLG